VKRTVQTLALAAALVALSLGIWRDYGAFTTLKRAVISYLVAYFLAAGTGLAARAALGAVKDPEPVAEPQPRRKPRRSRRARPRPEGADEAADANEQEPTVDAPTAANEPEPVTATP
jgi:hypothetical protein